MVTLTSLISKSSSMGSGLVDQPELTWCSFGASLAGVGSIAVFLQDRAKEQDYSSGLVIAILQVRALGASFQWPHD